jgi:hypothetical protein
LLIIPPPKLFVAQYPGGRTCGPATKLVAFKFIVPLLQTLAGLAVADEIIGKALTNKLTVEVAVHTPLVPVIV